MESKNLPLDTEFTQRLGENTGDSQGNGCVPGSTPPNLEIDEYDPGKVEDLLPDIPSFHEALSNCNIRPDYKGAKNKLICRSESHDYYSPSFSTSCDIENIDNLDFGSDCLSTSKSENHAYNIIFQSQLPDFSPGATENQAVSLTNIYPDSISRDDKAVDISNERAANLQTFVNQFQEALPSQFHTYDQITPILPQHYINPQPVFTVEELKSAPLMESNLYYPQNVNLSQPSNSVNHVNDNYSQGMVSNTQTLSGHPSYIPSNQYNVLVGDDGFKDYSRARELSNTIESKIVQDGYEIIQIPKYKPVNMIEKEVEVPVVHKIDTIVNVDKIQEVEKIVKVPYEKYVDKIVEETEIHYQDEIVEVFEYHDITKTIKVPEIRERVKYEPKFDIKTVPKYVEVPNLQFIDKYEEYEEVEEICKYVAQPQIIEVPKETIKTVVVPVKKVIEQEVIKPIIKTRKVPVEKIKYVDKYETVEVIRNIPQIIDVPVPQHIPKIEYVDQPYQVEKYRDIPVPYPVKKIIKPIYYYTNEVKYVEVPVYKPYLVIHDRVDFKPLNNDDSQIPLNTNSQDFSQGKDFHVKGVSHVVSIKPFNAEAQKNN